MKITAIYITKSPLSQIKESVSNYSSFNQIKIFDENNNLIEIPIITANSVRGALRNAGAQYLLDLLNKKVNKNIFHLLFSGGAISTSIINDIDKAIEIREKHPFVSLFGGAVSDMMMSGKMNIGNLYPITKETKDITKIDSEVSYKTLLSDMQAIKRDDAKEKGVEHIHCLGAGWSLEDIAIWQSIDGFNTFDSIAYYTTKNIDEFGSLNALENIYNILSLFK